MLLEPTLPRSAFFVFSYTPIYGGVSGDKTIVVLDLSPLGSHTHLIVRVFCCTQKYVFVRHHKVPNIHRQLFFWQLANCAWYDFAQPYCPHYVLKTEESLKVKDKIRSIRTNTVNEQYLDWFYQYVCTGCAVLEDKALTEEVLGLREVISASFV